MWAASSGGRSARWVQASSGSSFIASLYDSTLSRVGRYLNRGLPGSFPLPKSGKGPGGEMRKVRSKGEWSERYCPPNQGRGSTVGRQAGRQAGREWAAWQAGRQAGSGQRDRVQHMVSWAMAASMADRVCLILLFEGRVCPSGWWLLLPAHASCRSQMQHLLAHCPFPALQLHAEHHCCSSYANSN